ncbi:group III truncated hemoglobin [Roseibium litorale]|uniref:Group III truncated hemoglobin n=1 Tax=Roseibium litorale TaxID=2803841 RepID=A0ABR9CQ01_9HYPH|nr:group III truncated hemoglobin [Roseibium litorale]MBD8892943.1 group III truncated hemoglobin [Roseibium litorale]
MSVRSGTRQTEPLPDIRPAIAREPVHASITEEQISRLVSEFYGRIRLDARLGPIFEEKLAGRWPEHLAKMKTFWQSVLLKTGAYKGKPVPAHMKLNGLQVSDYPDWLQIFRSVAIEVFGGEAGLAVIEVAERIAQSLWFASFGTAGCALPEGMSGAKRP